MKSLYKLLTFTEDNKGIEDKEDKKNILFLSSKEGCIIENDKVYALLPIYYTDKVLYITEV